MFNKNFFSKGTEREKIKELMQKEGFQPKLINDKPNFVYETHKHPETKYLACIAGSMKVKVKGEEFNFETGDKLLIPGNTPHSGIVGPKGCIYFWSEKLVKK